MRRFASAFAVLLRAAAEGLLNFLAWLGNEPARAYHPEAHYMRGPGPAWRQKHILDRASDEIAHRHQ
jgi:hypothetical protein